MGEINYSIPMKPDPKSMPLKRVELSELGKEFLAWIVAPDEHLY